MLNGFAPSLMFIPLLVDFMRVLDNATPSLELAFTSRHHYYESLRPCAEHRYAPPCEVCSLGLLPSHLGDRFSRSAREPDVRSRCLYTGCRLAKTWVTARLISETRSPPILTSS